MTPYLAYFLGLFTGILILILIYIGALNSSTIRRFMNNTICFFPTKTPDE